MNKKFSHLDESQLKAVNHNQGPLLVLAGAGSGKTRVLACRIARLVQEKVCEPRNILAVTFTNKAAREMQERIASLTSQSLAKVMTVCTFHSFGAKILRKYGSDLGIAPNFSILNDNERISTVKSILRSAGKVSESDDPYDFCTRISLAKNTSETPDTLDEADPENGRLQRIYRDYHAILRKRQAVDFDDLLLLPLQLFKARRDILATYREMYTYLSIDEFQDTNAVQMQMAKLLAAPRNNIMVVGDDDQSIYSWRGAQIENILGFSSVFKKCTTVVLSKNYRSTDVIVQAASEVIQKNQTRKQKQISAVSTMGQRISSFYADDENEEVQWILETIRENVKNGEFLYRDHALLFRTNAVMARFEEQFRMERIPYIVQGAMSFFERKEIKDILAYLRFFANFYDEISLTRVLRVPNKGITPSTLQSLEELAGRKKFSLWEAFLHYQDALHLEEEQKLKIAGLVDFYDRHDKGFKAGELSRTLRAMLEELRYIELLERAYKNEPSLRIRLENVHEMIHTLELFEQRGKRAKPSLHAYLQECALIANDDSEEEQKKDGVVLITIHKAKGLEFPVVILPVLDDAVFPSYKSCLEGKIEEERRLFYVGMTRAKKALILTSFKTKIFRNKTIPVKPSRFIFEIPDRFFDGKFGEREEQNIVQLNRDFFAEMKKKFARAP